MVYDYFLVFINDTIIGAHSARSLNTLNQLINFNSNNT